MSYVHILYYISFVYIIVEAHISKNGEHSTQKATEAEKFYDDVYFDSDEEEMVLQGKM